MYVHYVMILLFREDCCLLKRTPLTLALVAQGQSVYWILTSCLFQLKYIGLKCSYVLCMHINDDILSHVVSDWCCI